MCFGSFGTFIEMAYEFDIGLIDCELTVSVANGI